MTIIASVENFGKVAKVFFDAGIGAANSELSVPLSATGERDVQYWAGHWASPPQEVAKLIPAIKAAGGIVDMNSDFERAVEKLGVKRVAVEGML